MITIFADTGKDNNGASAICISVRSGMAAEPTRAKCCSTDDMLQNEARSRIANLSRGPRATSGGLRFWRLIVNRGSGRIQSAAKCVVVCGHDAAETTGQVGQRPFPVSRSPRLSALRGVSLSRACGSSERRHWLGSRAGDDAVEEVRSQNTVSRCCMATGFRCQWQECVVPGYEGIRLCSKDVQFRVRAGQDDVVITARRAFMDWIAEST